MPEIVNSGNQYFHFYRDEGLLVPTTREDIEKERGITRIDGQIERTVEWKYKRLENLVDKISEQYARLENLKQELNSLEKELDRPLTNFETPVVTIEVEKIVEKIIYITFWDQVKDFFRKLF